MFDNLLEFSKLTLKQRYNFTIALIVFVLGWNILSLRDNVREERTKADEAKNICDERRAVLQGKIDLIQEQNIIEARESKKEYKDILFDVFKIKREIQNENDKTI